MNKKFQTEKKGKLSWVVIRQMAHDPQYKMGSHIPGYGQVVAVDVPEAQCECRFSGDMADASACELHGEGMAA